MNKSLGTRLRKYILEPPETIEVHPKDEAESPVEHDQEIEPNQLRHSECSRRPPVRYRLDEYASTGVQHVALNAYVGGSISK